MSIDIEPNTKFLGAERTNSWDHCFNGGDVSNAGNSDGNITMPILLSGVILTTVKEWKFFGGDAR
jgi:hypothetical protein